MTEILTKIIESPATNYILSFGGLGVVLMLALNSLHRKFKLSERAWGLITLASGAVGGVLFEMGGLVALPGSDTVSYVLSGFIGAVTAAASAGFSAVDLRSTITKSKE